MFSVLCSRIKKKKYNVALSLLPYKIQNNTNTKHYLTIQYDSCVVAQAPFQIQTAPTKFSFIYKTALAKSFFIYKRHIKYKPVQSPEYNIVENAHPA